MPRGQRLTPEQIKAKLAEVEGDSAELAGRKLGVHPMTVRKWRRRSGSTRTRRSRTVRASAAAKELSDTPSKADDGMITIRVRRESIKRLLDDADEEIKRQANQFASNVTTTTHEIREAVREYDRLRDIFQATATPSAN